MSENTFAKANPSNRFVDCNGARLWSTVSGVGIPVVFFNGGPGCDDYLEPVARLIDDRCHGIRFEPRGCGRSDWDGHYNLDTFLADAEAIRAAYGHERWLILGHSHGPNLALAYALRHPEHTIGIIGIAGGNVVNDRSWSETYHERLQSIGENLGGKVFRADPQANRLGNASWRSYIQRPTLFRELADLRVPCIFINASEDIRPNWPTQQLAELIPNARYVEIHGAAHTIWLTHAAALQQELRAALEQIVSPTSYTFGRPQ
ncbi:MAG: alpha/beta hydrolase [Roseiflexaceae bacterium]|nr:alpha/beta hydrolase [Roseiflexaceae bacterium]